MIVIQIFKKNRNSKDVYILNAKNRNWQFILIAKSRNWQLS